MPQDRVFGPHYVAHLQNRVSFDLVIFTFATGLDNTNAMNQVRIPLYEALARRMRGRGNVLVVTHWRSILPGLLNRRPGLIRWLATGQFRQMAENLHVFTPLLPLPMAVLEQMRAVPNISRLCFTWQVRRAMRRAGFENAHRVVTVNDPFHHHVLGLLNENLAVYDCLDDYALYGGAATPDPQVLSNERQVVERVDLVFTTSRTLYEKMNRQHGSVHYFPNAVDFDFFHQAMWSDLPDADALKGLPKPIIGFMGNLTHWYDFALLREVIQARPQWSFVFVGWVTPFANCTAEIRAIQSLPNAHFLGCQEFRDLPSFLRGFDVAIMPYAQNDAARAVNPDKMYQYLAAGVPLVATPCPEIAQFDRVIDVAAGARDFVLALDKRLTCGRGDARVMVGMDIANENTWDKRAEQEVALLEASLAGKLSQSHPVLDPSLD